MQCQCQLPYRCSCGLPDRRDPSSTLSLPSRPFVLAFCSSERLPARRCLRLLSTASSQWLLRRHAFASCQVLDSLFFCFVPAPMPTTYRLSCTPSRISTLPSPSPLSIFHLFSSCPLGSYHRKFIVPCFSTCSLLLPHSLCDNGETKANAQVMCSWW